MKKMWTRMWRRKWIVTAATLTLFLSVGAVAWAAGGDGMQPAGPAPGSGIVLDSVALAPAGTADPTLAVAGTPKPKDGAALKEKRAQRVKRLENLMKLVRDKMTPEDQAAYDQLAQTAKDQRAALQKARQDLAKTVKDLRDLTNKYIGGGSETAGPAGTAATIQ